MPAAIRISSLNCERRGSNAASVHQLAWLQADFMRVFSTKLWKTLWPSGFYRLRYLKPLWIVYLSNMALRVFGVQAKYIRMTFEAYFSSAEARPHVASQNRHPGSAFLQA